MQSKRDLAIILRSVPYQDRHRVVTALTEQHGQISAIAKNSIQSRRFGGCLDLFAASEWIFTYSPGAELYHLTEAKIREPFNGLHKSFEKLSLASVFNEYMIKVAPQGTACLELFKLHSNALSALSQASDESKITEESKNFQNSGSSKSTQNLMPLLFLNSYLAKVLQWSGNQPQIHQCLQCETSLERMNPLSELSSVIADAGWICPSCRNSGTRHIREREGASFKQSLLRLTPPALQDLQLSLQIPIRQFPLRAQASVQEHRDLFKYLEAMYIYHIPGFDKNPVKSLRFLGVTNTKIL